MSAIDVTTEVQLRAPAFSRLLGMLLRFAKDGQTLADVYSNEIHDEEEEQVLNELLEKMVPKYGTVPSTFPTQDMDIIAKMILKVVRFNAAHTYISSKLSMCMIIQSVGLVLDTNGTLAGKNMRDKEMVLLNNKLCDIGKLIIERNVIVTAEEVTVTGHEFNPDSQFVVFRIL